MEQRIKMIMAKVFGVPAETIKDETSPYTIANWDSLKHVDMVLALQKEFSIRFEDEEIPTMINYKTIVNTIRAYVE